MVFGRSRFLCSDWLLQEWGKWRLLDEYCLCHRYVNWATMDRSEQNTVCSIDPIVPTDPCTGIPHLSDGLGTRTVMKGGNGWKVEPGLCLVYKRCFWCCFFASKLQMPFLSFKFLLSEKTSDNKFSLFPFWNELDQELKGTCVLSLTQTHTKIVWITIS